MQLRLASGAKFEDRIDTDSSQIGAMASREVAGPRQHLRRGVSRWPAGRLVVWLHRLFSYHRYRFGAVIIPLGAEDGWGG